MNFSIRQGKVRFEVFPLKLWDEISKIDVTFKFYLSLTFMHESGSEPPPLPFHWQHSYISWVVYLGSIHAKMHWRQEDFNIEDEKKKKRQDLSYSIVSDTLTSSLTDISVQPKKPFSLHKLSIASFSMGLVLDKSLWRLNEKKNGEIWIIEFNQRDVDWKQE